MFFPQTKKSELPTEEILFISSHIFLFLHPLLECLTFVCAPLSLFLSLSFPLLLWLVAELCAADDVSHGSAAAFYHFTLLSLFSPSTISLFIISPVREEKKRLFIPAATARVHLIYFCCIFCVLWKWGVLNRGQTIAIERKGEKLARRQSIIPLITGKVNIWAAKRPIITKSTRTFNRLWASSFGVL